jgi:hypothetical protein
MRVVVVSTGRKIKKAISVEIAFYIIAFHIAG